jgi:hypothetical protein
MSDRIHAYAAINKGDKLKPFEYDPGALGADQVEIAVEYCGLCHSDLSTRDKEQLKKIAGSLNFILSTVNATLDWQEYIA